MPFKLIKLCHFRGMHGRLIMYLNIIMMVFWGWLLGPVGALLSAPLTMIVKIVCEHVDEWKWAAHLLDSPVEGLEQRMTARLAGAMQNQPLQPQDVPPTSSSGAGDTT